MEVKLDIDLRLSNEEREAFTRGPGPVALVNKRRSIIHILFPGHTGYYRDRLPPFLRGTFPSYTRRWIRRNYGPISI